MDSDELECVICCEPMQESTALPCNCKIDYCGKCWDRSLAQSFNSSGQARCPTCRAHVRVDFDAEKGCLVFSRGTEDLPVNQAGYSDSTTPAGLPGLLQRRALLEETLEESRTNAVNRLAQQALPAQVRILQQYGAERPMLKKLASSPADALQEMDLSASELIRHIVAGGGNVDDCSEEKEPLMKHLIETSGALALAAYWAGTEVVANPQCVCGSSLERVSGKERLSRYLEKSCPRGTASFQQRFQTMARRGSSGVICDLCDEQVPLARSLWTCRNGGSTILHATAYDICDVCFVSNSCSLQSATPDTG